jgi:hypothetical protein
MGSAGGSPRVILPSLKLARFEYLRMNNHLCTCVALFLGASSLACAQLEMQHAPPDTGTATVSSVERDRAEGLIKLDVVVTDAAGNPVSGLGEADFNLIENGRPQNILSFQAFTGRGGGSEPPVKIILLIDTIELAESLAREERLAVMSYLRQGGGRLDRPVSVFLLADTGLWTVAPSGDGTSWFATMLAGKEDRCRRDRRTLPRTLH